MTFGKVDPFLCFPFSMLHFIMFLEACGDLDEPSHSHPPKREFWVHPFDLLSLFSSRLTQFSKNMDLKTFFQALATSFLPHFRHPRAPPLPPQVQ